MNVLKVTEEQLRKALDSKRHLRNNLESYDINNISEEGASELRQDINQLYKEIEDLDEIYSLVIDKCEKYGIDIVID